MVIELGHEICGDLEAAASREWLATNGIGGFASGTLAGMLTRRYHGLLVAALQPPVGRCLLVSKFDDTALYKGQAYPLFSNRWRDGTVEPEGYRHIERFHLDGAVPVWTFALADARLEKRIWMQPGANTTYVRYRLAEASAPLELRARALVNCRDFHGETRGGWQMGIQALPHGLRLSPPEDAAPFYLFASGAEITPRHEWCPGLVLSVERYRGFDGLEDVLCAAQFSARLEPGAAITLLATTEADAELDAYAARQRHEEQVLARFRSAMPAGASDPSGAVEQLALAADQFIVQRSIPGEAAPGRSVIAGYPWFADWGRDTMISLPGLALATGRAEIAGRILRTFAHFLDQGMLPNRFPDEGQAPEYNTVDATLWYFEALRAYYEHTGDESLLADLYPSLEEIIRWHRRGTRYNIHVDPGDGLVYAGEAGVQLTWMDAKVDDWVVTPRIGKPVEVNALWYNALRCMADFARRLGQSPEPYERMAERVQTSFARFWYAAGGYLYDLIDGPEGDDPSLRPNQVMAVSLTHSALSRERQKAVVDICTRHLLTPYGLRSLAPSEAHYVGRYGGDRYARDGAYHQGTVWGWLIGPYTSAHLRVYAERESARSLLRPLFDHLCDHGVGTLSEIFDGDAPFTARGCFAQAWSVAEVLRAWVATGTRQREEHYDDKIA